MTGSSGVTVVMSVFNEPVDYIRESIDSILAQTFSDFRLIIVNDNPESQELCNELNDYVLHDSRIRVLHNQENVGLTVSLNRAISQVSSKYIARMDADDVAIETRLETQFSFLESNPNIDICGSFVDIIDKNGNCSGKYSYPISSGQIKAKMFLRDCVCHPSVMIKTARLKELSGYNDEFKKSQDYELWVRSIISGLQFSNIETSLLKYRVHGGNISSQYSAQQECFAKKCKIKLYEHYSNFESADVIYKILNESFNLRRFLMGLPKLLAMINKIVTENKDISCLYMLLIISKRIIYLTYKRIVS